MTTIIKPALKRSESLSSAVNDDDDQVSISSHFDDGSQASDKLTANGSSNGNNGTSEEEAELIAQTETRAVGYIKLVVTIVLLISTVVVGVAVFYYVRNTEVREFEKAFNDGALKILSGVGLGLDLVLMATESFAIDLVGTAKADGQNWPFVTMDNFGIQVYKLRKITNSDVVIVMPYVSNDNRETWEEYTGNNVRWINESLAVQASDPNWRSPMNYGWEETNMNVIHNDDLEPIADRDMYFPKWQSTPVIGNSPVYNRDEYSRVENQQPIDDIITNKNVILQQIPNIHSGGDPESVPPGRVAIFEKFDIDIYEPFTTIFYPILSNIAEAVNVNENKGDLVGILSVTIDFRDLLKNVLPPGSNNFRAVFASECGHYYEYRIDGPKATYIGEKDYNGGFENNPRLHPDEQRVRLLDLQDYALANHQYDGLPLSSTYCPFYISTYPSEEMKNEFMSKDPLVFTLAAVFIFFFTAFIFTVYDRLVEKRQRKVMLAALRSSAIVSSLFPSAVRDQIYSSNDKAKNSNSNNNSSKNRLQGYLTKNVKGEEENVNSSPIAELYPDSTVMFADIAGFTAWSSTREASEVFTLLEAVYGAFDATAKRRRVFKVETIGDCYVAVAGLPEPRKDHAVVMARFASDCRQHMQDITKKLEVTLGPDTTDLTVRIGLNSGPVTAGVLRGERSRFQLFGDTVNTAARMESTGLKSKIQVSSSTAMLLNAAGKHHWVTPREDLVTAKGKGSLQTYWVEPHVQSASTTSGSSVHNSDNTEAIDVRQVDEKCDRMITWNMEVLATSLKQIVAHRNACGTVQYNKSSAKKSFAASINSKGSNTTPLEEFVEIIEMPTFDKKINHNVMNIANVDLSTEVTQQLHRYVVAIASMYRDNDFHNFEHASHVTMSVVKLLRRVVTPKDVLEANNGKSKNYAASLHEFTYGLTSDPLTQFACIFAALIHDVDHQGVSNNQLISEKSQLAQVYHERSVAEQNSVDLAWQMLSCEDFVDLRKAICATTDEEARFRQLVVNIVMATDIMDKDLNKLRHERWQAAFAQDSDSNSGSSGKTESNYQMNRKATIVIEHMIQASDVSHTMQHWQIYRKWNERLFMEMYKAYKIGRGGANDPASFWYKGEIGFFDHYILPLAGKLRDCGVFGVSSDEYLNYAHKNREEWIEKGQQIVAEMVNRYHHNNNV